MEETKTKRRMVCIKREHWLNYAIPTPERDCVLGVIKEWLSQVTTSGLIALLPEIARAADSDEVVDPMIELDVPVNDEDSETRGYIVVEDESQKQAGRPDQDQASSGR